MARPVSWLPRLHLIRQAVDGSIRSHYTRSELEQLFQLQPRAAAYLLDLLPTVMVGQNRMVEREALAAFLERVNDCTGDLPSLFARMREENARDSQKKLRHLVRRDVSPATLSMGLPEGLSLSRGRVEMSFATVEDLTRMMLTVALLLESDGDEFVRRYEPEPPPERESGAAAEVAALFAELDADERAQGRACVETATAKAE